MAFDEKTVSNPVPNASAQHHADVLSTLPKGHHGLDRPELGISVFEISVLLLVVGIGCGAFLKGKEMMQHAKTSALMDRVTEVQAAWYAFNDRYNATPGDSAPNGNHNGQIDTAVESANLWTHLFQAGYLTQLSIEGGAYCADAACLANGFGGHMQVRWSGSHHELHTGEGIPVQILAALDTRYDDGLPLTGKVRVSDGEGCQVEGHYQPAAVECDAVFHWL